jgi:hypothetical protein
VDKKKVKKYQHQCILIPLPSLITDHFLPIYMRREQCLLFLSMAKEETYSAIVFFFVLETTYIYDGLGTTNKHQPINVLLLHKKRGRNYSP